MDDGLHFPSISETQAAWLEMLFEEEVQPAIDLMARNTTPRPNRFPILCYKACLNLIKSDLMSVIEDFHGKGFLDKGSNATFISLISTKQGEEQLADFSSGAPNREYL